MENIELWIIGLLLILCMYFSLQNKENRYWRDYYKDQYFEQKDMVDKYIKKHIEKNGFKKRRTY